MIAGLGHQLVPPVVAARLHRHFAAGALVDDDMFYRGALVHRFVDRRLQLHFAAAAIGAVLGDDGDRLLIADAIDHRIGAEAAENDRMHRPDARAGQHRHRQLGHHSHVNGNPVALLNAQPFSTLANFSTSTRSC